LREAHAAQCHEFQAAESEGRTGEFTEEIDDDDVPSEDDYEEEDEESGE
jgi:hypothetical protein